MAIAQHSISTTRTADEIEALDVPTMLFRHLAVQPEAGDYVIITSADGALFLGTVEDVDDDGTLVALT